MRGESVDVFVMLAVSLFAMIAGSLPGHLRFSLEKEGRIISIVSCLRQSAHLYWYRGCGAGQRGCRDRRLATGPPFPQPRSPRPGQRSGEERDVPGTPEQS